MTGGYCKGLCRCVRLFKLKLLHELDILAYHNSQGIMPIGLCRILSVNHMVFMSSAEPKLCKAGECI